MTFGDFHFLRPLALPLLLALPLFGALWRRRSAEAGSWRAAVDAHLLPHVVERSDAGVSRLPVALAALAWTLATFALAGPAWEHESAPLQRNQAARVIALSLSPSMLAQDEKPSRLQRARYKIRDLLARSRDLQTALIGYAGDAFIAAPLTDDTATVANLLDALDPSTMPVTGNVAARAIERGVALIEQAGLHRGDILLVTDGVDAGATAAARAAARRGFTVSVLGVGTTEGAPVPLAEGDFRKDASGRVELARLDETDLRAVAEAGGGRYARLGTDAGDLDAVLIDRAESAAEAETKGKNEGTAQQALRWRDRGPWLVLAALPFALLLFRRGWLLMIALAFVALPTSQARANGFADLWQRADQQAAAALANGDAARALEVAPTPDWRGGAAYRSGDYAKALQNYTATFGATGAYNRGNALAKLGRYEDAIAAYDEALKIEPGMEDAIANRKAVEDFLKKKAEEQKNKDAQKNSEGQQQPGNQGQSSPDDAQQGQQSPSQNGQGSPQYTPSAQDPSQAQPQPQQGQSPQDQTGAKPEDSKDAPSADAAKGEKKPGEETAQGESKSAGRAADSPPPDASAQQPSQGQQQDLREKIDHALAGETDPNGKRRDEGGDAPARVPVDDRTREQQQALEQWLMRVPDDPGGLLRRKFMLDYQRRQQRGEEERP